jgi:hypothetical protein
LECSGAGAVILYARLLPGELVGRLQVPQLRDGWSIAIVNQQWLKESPGKRRDKECHGLRATQLADTLNVGVQECWRFDHRFEN